MEEWEAEIDWLAGKYTHTKEQLRRELRDLESCCDFFIKTMR